VNLEEIAGLAILAAVAVAAFRVFWRKSPKPGDYYESGIGMQEPRNDGQGNDYL